MTLTLTRAGGSNAGPFTPPNPGSAYSLLAHPKYCFKDAGATQNCGDNDPIYTWVDRFGSGFNATQSMPAARPILRNVGGKWLVFINGYNQWMQISSSLSYSTQSASLWCSYVPIQTGLIQVPFRVGGGNVLNPYTNQTSDSVDVAYMEANTAPNTSQAVNRSRINTVGLLLGSSSAITRVNGVDTSAGAASLSTQTGGLIGADNNSNNNYQLAGAIAELLFYPTQQNDTVAAQVEAYFANYNYSAFPYPTNINMIVCDGASTTLGRASAFGGPNYVAYPAQLYANLADPALSVNLGVTSMATSTMTSLAPTRVDPHYNAARLNNVVVGWEIVNSVVQQGKTGAQAYADYVTYFTARKAVGWKTLVLDADIPSGATSGQQTAIAAANALVDADFPTATTVPYTYSPGPGVTYGDYMLKISAMTDLVFTDGFHYNAASYALIGQRVAAALALMLPSYMHWDDGSQVYWDDGTPVLWG